MSWKRLTLFEEGAVGLIEGLRFESPTQGTAAVDRAGPGRGAMRHSNRRTPATPGRCSKPARRGPATCRSSSARLAHFRRCGVEILPYRTARRQRVAQGGGVCRSGGRVPSGAAPAAVEPPPPGQLHY